MSLSIDTDEQLGARYFDNLYGGCTEETLMAWVVSGGYWRIFYSREDGISASQCLTANIPRPWVPVFIECFRPFMRS